MITVKVPVVSLGVQAFCVPSSIPGIEMIIKSLMNKCMIQFTQSTILTGYGVGVGGVKA